MSVSMERLGLISVEILILVWRFSALGQRSLGRYCAFPKRDDCCTDSARRVAYCAQACAFMVSKQGVWPVLVHG